MTRFSDTSLRWKVTDLQNLGVHIPGENSRPHHGETVCDRTHVFGALIGSTRHVLRPHICLIQAIQDLSNFESTTLHMILDLQIPCLDVALMTHALPLRQRERT